MNRNTPYPRKGKRVFFIFFIIASYFALSLAVMLLWNALLPEILHIGKINYVQSMGLFILSRILFGGFHFGGRKSRPPFANPVFREKFMAMSEEEKTKFKEQWQARCGKR